MSHHSSSAHRASWRRWLRPLCRPAAGVGPFEAEARHRARLTERDVRECTSPNLTLPEDAGYMLQRPIGAAYDSAVLRRTAPACRILEVGGARIAYFQPSHAVKPLNLLGQARVINPLHPYFGQVGPVAEFSPDPWRAVGLTFPDDDDPTFVVYVPVDAVEPVRPETEETIALPVCVGSDPYAHLDDVPYLGRVSR